MLFFIRLFALHICLVSFEKFSYDFISGFSIRDKTMQNKMVKNMLKIFVAATIVGGIFSVCGADVASAQSYPPATPPSVAGSGNVAANTNAGGSESVKDGITKRLEILETNVNNFVPMLMKNYDGITKIRDNADALVAEMKKQLQEVKHLTNVFDLRLLELTTRLERLEKNLGGVSGARESINYVNNPMDVELKNLSDSSVGGSVANDSSGAAIPAPGQPVNPSPVTIPANPQNTTAPTSDAKPVAAVAPENTSVVSTPASAFAQNQNMAVANMLSTQNENSRPYYDPLMNNRIIIPDL